MANGPFYSKGRYRCEIMDQGLTKAKTGTVQIALKIKVLEGTQPAMLLEAQYERTVFLPVTDNTMQYLVPKLDALGYTRDSIRFIDLSAPNCHDMRGQQAEFFCKHENDLQGELREKWDVASSQGSTALDLTPPDAKAIRDMDLLFAKSRKEAGLKTTPKPAPRPAPVAAGFTDDDVPF